MSFQLFLFITAMLWLVVIGVLLVIVIRKAQSPLLQEISRILSGSSRVPQPVVSEPDNSSPITTTAPPSSKTSQNLQVLYQEKLSVLGSYLDQQQRMFTAIWEMNDGYLLQTVRSDSSQVDYLKVSDHQLNSLASTPSALVGTQGTSSRMLRSIGGRFDQRHATTIQIAVVGRNIVTGGLEPIPTWSAGAAGQHRNGYRPFQEIFAMPSSSEL